ncbi:hypothetical protein PBI_THONKO_79 [Mycobacterium phage Thonko]|uniref:Uncharacterized protein n=1 Tax=Mycobacterium phage Thonko TaxID=2282910 RepID=A0A346FCC5_9CAUD|nr:hypothetical protein I5G57_gp079 [Mycobacterium phage Thonko]AXN53350.1 hypothetical protein PBI_THONKO_79 [Mycobacterium phage Thonko]
MIDVRLPDFDPRPHIIAAVILSCLAFGLALAALAVAIVVDLDGLGIGAP